MPFIVNIIHNSTLIVIVADNNRQKIFIELDLVKL